MRYYTQKAHQDEAEAFDSIHKHVKNEIKHTLNETKKKTIADAKKEGKTLLEVNPVYFNDAFWRELVEYWTSEAHTRRSNVASQNRKKLKTLHSAGAKSFTEIEEVRNYIYVP